MTYRVWTLDDFKDATDDERDDSSWVVPARRGILNPENFAPCEDARDAAQQFAKHYHYDRGWENTWPLDFVVHDGEKYYLVSVERDFDPTFSAARPKEIKP